MPGLQQFSELHRTFSGSEYGRKLASEVRWERYKPEDTPNEEWVRLLGRDFSNLEHLYLTYNLCAAFIHHSEEYQPDLLSEDDKELLLLTGVTHDWGEAITTDISYGDKTPDDDAKEGMAFSKIATELFPDRADQFAQVQEIIFDHNGENNRLGAIFSTIEHVGYMRTALIAVDVLVAKKEEAAPANVQAGLKWLVADVLSNTVGKLVAQSTRYSAVDAAAYLNMAKIDVAFEMVFANPEAFLNYGDKKIEKMLDFLDAEQAWLKYKKQLADIDPTEPAV